VADVKYKAALNVSVALVPRVGAVPKLWVAVISSPMNEVHIDWVLAIIVPFVGFAQLTFTLYARDFHRE
jgi:hypothetical protein